MKGLVFIVEIGKRGKGDICQKSDRLRLRTEAMSYNSLNDKKKGFLFGYGELTQVVCCIEVMSVKTFWNSPISSPACAKQNVFSLTMILQCSAFVLYVQEAE